MKNNTTISIILFIIFMVAYSCNKKENIPDNEIIEITDPTDLFVGKYNFIDTCIQTEWDPGTVIITDTTGTSNDTNYHVTLNFADTLIIIPSTYEVEIRKDETRDGHIFISNFNNQGTDVVAIVDGEGSMYLTDEGKLVSMHIIDGQGNLSGDSLNINYKFENFDGLTIDCSIIGIKDQ